MSELPRGWVEAEFGDVFDFKGGSQPPKSEFYSEPSEGRVRLLQIRDFASDEKAVYIRDNGKWPKCSAADIMIGRYGASVGKILSGKAGAYNVALVKLEFPQMEFDRRWVQSYLKTDHFQRPLFQISRSAQNGFNKEDLKEVPVPIPPLAEQKRIVAKLEALSAKSARARTELARIETLVSRYKQAVLGKAFSGAVDHKELSELVVRIKAGKNLRCEERPPHSDEKGVVKVSAVTWGEFRPDQSKTLPSDFEPDEDTRIKSCDFLFSRANTIDLVGAVVIVGDTPDNLYLSDKILRLEFREPIDKWLLWYLRSPMGREALMNISSGNQLSMRNIGQKSLLSLSIPYADFELRDEIVRRIEAAFAKIDRLAGEAKRVLELVGKLDEAVLAKAFRGELVPQDENDEPAIVLLERIRAERAAAPKAKRGRRPPA